MVAGMAQAPLAAAVAASSDFSRAMSKSSGKGGRHASGGTMTASRASAIQSAGARNPDSRTATTGFASRAQSAGATNANSDGGSGKK